MTTKPIHLSASDHEQLRLRLSLAAPGRRPGGPIDSLRAELDRAIVVPDEALPPNVVRIGSRVHVRDLDSSDEEQVVLVLPEQANPEQNRVSIFAPLGIALLGYVEGDDLAWPAPSGLRRLRILGVS